MDVELESWKAAGQYFDYLGFPIFYRKSGSGPNLLATAQAVTALLGKSYPLAVGELTLCRR